MRTHAENLRQGQEITFRGQKYRLTADAQVTPSRVAVLQVVNLKTGSETQIMPSARTQFTAR